MAGVGARDIKRKIKSINNTKQITKAMELVSTAKLKKNKARFENTKPYFHKVINTVEDVLLNETRVKHPLMESREVNKSLYIIIAADKGLCGGYNVNVLKAGVNAIDYVDKTKLITIGKKARDFFTKRDYDVVESYIGISEKPKYEDAKKIFQVAKKLYLQNEVDEVNIVYTEMLSSISLEPTVKRLLPMNIYENKDEEDKTVSLGEEEFVSDLISYEPSPESVMDMLIPKYIESIIYGALIETAAAEQSARRNAMESASDNAEEMIESLTLHYNQARQAAITQEISEIVGGANALE